MKAFQRATTPERTGRRKKQGQWGAVWKRLCRNKLAMVGLVIVLLLVLMAILADVIAPYSYDQIDLVNRFQTPSLQHLFGTDNYGRDIFSRLIYGGRISLLVSVLAVVISVSAGSLIGALSGYFGGKIDAVIMRLIDILQAVPGTLLAVCVSAMLGGGVWQTAVAIAISGIVPSSRMMRATTLSIRNQEYIEAAQAAGSSTMRLILTHVLPNCLAPIIVDTSLRLGGNIMTISGLSFIGLGVQPPIPEWGAILNAGRDYIRDFPYLILFPAIMIALTMFGFNILGDGLRDAMDPKLKD